MAKTILTISLLMVSSFCVNAQESIIFKQNRLLLGGGVSFHFNDWNQTEINNGDPTFDDYIRTRNAFTFTPMFGIFSKDFVMLGIKPTITRREETNFYQNSEYENSWGNKSYEYGASIFITHMYPVYKRFGATLEHEAGYKRHNGSIHRSWTNFENNIIIDETSHDYTETGNKYFAGISLLLYYSMTDNFLIQTKIGQLFYEHGNTTVTDDHNDGEMIDKNTVSSGGLNLITTLSFDKILSFSYIF